MKFENLVFLHFLWALPVLIAFYIYAARRRQMVVDKFAVSETFKRLIPESSVFKSFLKPALLVISFGLLAFSLTGPRWGYNWEEVKRRGIDIVIAVDVSRSMLSEDIKPNRLERAKREILDLVNMLQGDRIALVAFAGVAFLECPLTLDYSAATLFLDSIDCDLIPIQGTSISVAIIKAMEAFGAKKKTSRAIILITDGEDHDAKAQEAAKLAKGRGIRIYTIGVGGIEGAPIPLESGGFKKARDGNLVVSKLNEELLREIALETGGAFVRSVSGDMDLEEIYLNEIKKTMEGQELRSSKRKRWQERYQIFLFFAFFFLTMEVFLTRRKRAIRRIFRAGVFIFLIAPFNAHGLNLDSDRIKASDLYGKGKYDESLKLFSESLVRNPDDFSLHFNTGQNYYMLKQYDKAIDSFNNAALKAVDEEGEEERAHFGSGNAYFHLGKLEQAVLAYKRVMKLNPEHEAAKKNLALTLREIKKRMKDQKNTEKRRKEQQKQQKQKDQQCKQGREGDSEKKPGEKKNNGRKDGQGEEKDQQKKQGEKAGKSGKEGEGRGKKKEGKAQGFTPHKMSEEEAKKWLESLNEEDSRKKFRIKAIPGGSYQHEKDW